MLPSAAPITPITHLLAEAVPVHQVAGRADTALGAAAAFSPASPSSSSFFSSWQQDLDLLRGTHREEVNIGLAIVAS